MAINLSFEHKKDLKISGLNCFNRNELISKPVLPELCLPLP